MTKMNSKFYLAKAIEDNVVLDAAAACVYPHGKGGEQRSVQLWYLSLKGLQ